ncbi:MAG: hypothetical protein J5725_00840 [Bacteroidales bacterium]|nr:hypothetical protein [Bacteroidales bacterium]
MAYATLADIKGRITRTLSQTEETVCTNLLDDVAILIDAYNVNASSNAKKVVSCNAVIRAIGTGDSDIPVGATQGSMAALGYSQSWTIGSGGATAELYLSRTDKKLLGSGNSIGSYSPVEELVPRG